MSSLRTFFMLFKIYFRKNLVLNSTLFEYMYQD